MYIKCVTHVCVCMYVCMYVCMCRSGTNTAGSVGAAWDEQCGCFVRLPFRGWHDLIRIGRRSYVLQDSLWKFKILKFKFFEILLLLIFVKFSYWWMYVCMYVCMYDYWCTACMFVPFVCMYCMYVLNVRMHWCTACMYVPYVCRYCMYVWDL